MRKTCRTCEIEKDILDFCIVNKNKDGRNNFCKTCQNKKDKVYRESNKAVGRDRMRRWRKNNPEKAKKSYKNWRAKNLQKLRKQALEKQKENRKDSMYKFKESIRNRIRNSLKHSGVRKNSKTSEILGCSFQEFRDHIESQFKPWMTWENRGLYNGQYSFGWDLDHIIPMREGNTKQEIIKLNHFSNFQPLCSKINRSIKK